MRKSYILILFLIILIAGGCGGKDKIKPSADSLLATESFEKIDEIRKAYEAKNFAELQTRADVGHIENFFALGFESAKLNFTHRMVRITDQFVIVNLNWQGNWHTAKGKDLANRGVADLVLHRETLKLVKIDGDNPFVIPSSAISP